MEYRMWFLPVALLTMVSLWAVGCGDGEEDDDRDTGPSDVAMDVQEDVMDVEEDMGEDAEEDVEEHVSDIEEDMEEDGDDMDAEMDAEMDVEEDGDDMDAEMDAEMDIEEDAPGTGPPGVGDVIITEFMADPDALADGSGEYFELYNTSSTQAFELEGCVVEDLSADSHTIAATGGSFVIPASGYVTLANSDMPGFTSDYNYGGNWFLSNSGDEIQLSCGGTVIDTVDYDNGPNWAGNQPATGAAKGLDPTLLNATDNDDGDNWCDQTTSLPNTTDNGTPGAANDPCS